ncbi:Rpn family recombination-promoting nuclease/putative transposase [Paenibacillus sp. IB182363]|uniref:Rpn family recombination-promoting nuclease/putative transposase n=2 Tax=Paenibacillus oceani TaxID=2772510 RepID=A0A927H3V2_9BACL|nr:Rpn family recombination-promoting nuclease/putative transposase [Paenibacillus oceani]
MELIVNRQEGKRVAVRRLKPKNDFIFQRLFGEQDTKESLISLLNAILQLQGTESIADITVIENKQLDKLFIDDKTGRLDVRAETLDGVQFDIEIQLANQRNMPRRTLFYASKLYISSIKAGGKYEDLKKTVAINLLDFHLFSFERFHSTFHFYEDHEERFMLTDAMELHFIEYPKFANMKKNLNNPLHRWLLFLDEKLPEEQLEELIRMDPVIKKAEERLEWLSSDEETLRLYEAREHSLIERNSLIAEGKAQGRAEGRAEGKKEIAKQMLAKGLEPALIAELTGLPLDEIREMAKNGG